MDDQFGRPTWTRTLAEFMAFVIAEKRHLVFIICLMKTAVAGISLLKKFLKDTEVEVLPVDSTQFPQRQKTTIFCHGFK